MNTGLALPLIDLRPPPVDLRSEVLAGLQATPKTLPCKLFYDAAGLRLFERICRLPEYYPTRTEIGILRREGEAIARRVGPQALVIGFGTGGGTKARMLLRALRDPAGYVAIDIAGDAVAESAEAIAADFPGLTVQPVCADYTRRLALDFSRIPHRRRVAFFPGSTIGNMTPPEARRFLARVAKLVGRGGALLLGVDLVKPVEVLEAAYDDAEGVTAAFNRNALAHVNRAVGADFDPDAFRHRAHFSEEHSRVEMHLVSAIDQVVCVGGEAIAFRAGESIHTENSHKWRLSGLAGIAARAGFAVEATWTDPQRWFAVTLLVA